MNTKPNTIFALLSPILLAVAVLTLTACGWSSASQTYANRNDPGDEPVVIEAKTERPKVDNNPCKVDAFTIYFIDKESRSTKDVRCDTGKTVNVTRSDISEAEYRSARVDNLPIERWYLLVEPNPGDYRRLQAINNNELMGLSRIYSLKYHNRQESTGLLVYLFESQTTTP